MFPQSRNKIFVTKLAGDGFSYRSMNDDIKCVSCKAVFKDWQSGWKGAHDAHAPWCRTKSKNEEVRGSTFSPYEKFAMLHVTALTIYGLGKVKEKNENAEKADHCEQITKGACNNKEFPSESEICHISPHFPEFLRLVQAPPTLTIHVFVLPEAPNVVQAIDEPIIPMRSARLRYLSFATADIERPIWPSRLSKEGFYCEGLCIKCFYCSCNSSQQHKANCERERCNIPWGRTDFPPVLPEHMYKIMGARPKPVLKSYGAGLLAPSANIRPEQPLFGDDNAEVDHPSSGPDEHQSGMTTISAAEIYNVGQEIRQPVGLQPRDQRGVVQYPHFSTTSSRMASFLNWPLTDAFHPRTLVELGFYYAGQADIIRCFSCGVEKRMQSWDQLVELALLHPEVCAFHSARNSPA